MGVEHTLVLTQLELGGQAGLVAVVEPGGQALRGGKEVDISRDQARGDVVVGLLDVRVFQTRLLGAGSAGPDAGAGGYGQGYRPDFAALFQRTANGLLYKGWKTIPGHWPGRQAVPG